MNAAAEFLAERIGLRLDGTAAARIERVARECARRANCPPAHYGRLLAEEPHRAQELIDQMTVQESGFFRHPEQFDHLAAQLSSFPAPAVIWSAGCANGQEPWSLAMLLEERGLAGWHVVATDVSAGALQRARRGEYSERELRSLDDGRRRRFFPDGRAVPRLRERVRFLHHNLVTGGPPAEAGACRVVLCRNVLIYLRRDAIDAVADGLRRRMPDGSLLLVGAGEAVGRLPGFRHGTVAGAYVREASPAISPQEAQLEPGSRPLASLLAEGARLAASGQLEAAAACYRRAGFLVPADPRPRRRLAEILARLETGP